MLEMGKSDPIRVLQAAQAFAIVMGLEDHFYSMGNSEADICQEITSKLTAPGRQRIDSLRKMRRQGRRLKRNATIPNHVAPEPPSSKKMRRPTRLTVDQEYSHDSLNSIRNRMKTYVRKFKKRDTSQMGASAFRDILSSRNKKKLPLQGSSSSNTTTSTLMSPGEKGAQRFRETLSSPSSLHRQKRRSSSAVQLFKMTLLSPNATRRMSRMRSSTTTSRSGDELTLPPGLVSHR